MKNKNIRKNPTASEIKTTYIIDTTIILMEKIYKKIIFI